MIKTELEKSTITRSGVLASPIWVNIDEIHFPEVGWNDFTMLILTQWAEELQKNEVVYNLHFMDGPFFLRISNTKDGCFASGIHRKGTSAEEEFSVRISLSDFLLNLLAVSQSVLDRTKSMEIDKLDYESFREAFDRLKRSVEH